MLEEAIKTKIAISPTTTATSLKNKDGSFAITKLQTARTATNCVVQFYVAKAS